MSLWNTDFVGKYELHPRTMSSQEKQLIPVLPEWYIIPQEVVDICKHAQATTGKPTQMRNFLLRGPSGTGKTRSAKAIAAGLGLPYMAYTCSAGTEIFDFIGQIFRIPIRVLPGMHSLIMKSDFGEYGWNQLCQRIQNDESARFG